MCSTTPKTKAASPGVNTPSKIQKTAGAGAPAPNAFGGFQERVPNAVFLSTSGEPTFLASAKKFYTYFGLKPQDIKSVEALVIALADLPAATVYDRLLMVSHAHPRGMILPFFTDGVKGTNKEVFRGFARSDLDGLKILSPFEEEPVFNWDSVFTTIMSNIRAVPARAAALDPFGLKTKGLPEGKLRQFFEQCFNVVFVNTTGHVKNKSGNNISGDEKNTFANFVGEIANQIGKLIENTNVNGNTITKPHLTALKTMLTGLNLVNDLTATSIYRMSSYVPDNMNYYPTLKNATRAVKDDFHAKIVKMRQHFKPTSAIDIRGCRAGDEADYLTAIREFFDRPEEPRLSVSAPIWFQSYPALAFEIPNTRSDIAHNLSNKIFLNTVAHDEQMKGAKAWAALLKVDPLHTGFWTTLFSGTPANFMSLTWRSTIPPLFVPTPGLAALTPLALADIIAKLKDMFNVPAGSVPNASQIASNDAAAMQTFMTAAKDSLETGDGIYYYMLFAGLPLFFFNKDKFLNHEGLMVLKTFEHDALQSWYKCVWNGTLPADASNASTSATINNEDSRRGTMLQADRNLATSEVALCPATEYGSRIQTSP